MSESFQEVQATSYQCSICRGPFDIEKEGGIRGFIGMIPVAFCPTCKAGVADFGQQMDMTFEQIYDQLMSTLDLLNQEDPPQDLIEQVKARVQECLETCD